MLQGLVAPPSLLPEEEVEVLTGLHVKWGAGVVGWEGGREGGRVERSVSPAILLCPSF